MRRYLSLKSLVLLFVLIIILADATILFRHKKVLAQPGPAGVALEGLRNLSITDGITANPCEQITVPVDIDNAADIAGIDLEIAFDPDILKLVNVEKADLTGTFLLMHGDSGDGTLWVSLAYHTGITSGTGSLVYLIFEVLPSAVAYDSTEVSIRKVLLYNEAAEPIEGVIDQNGQIAIQWQKMHFPKGWSMFSLPVISENAPIQILFPDAVVLYKYSSDNGYIRVSGNEQLEAGRGYWILFNEDQSYALTGQPIEMYNKKINEDGWEMIGGCTCPAQASISQGKINVIYSYVPGQGYQRITESDDLESAKGYWIQFLNTGSDSILEVAGFGF
ncbi:MAG: cohesin domain-containing protein [bacterium]